MKVCLVFDDYKIHGILTFSVTTDSEGITRLLADGKQLGTFDKILGVWDITGVGAYKSFAVEMEVG